MCVWRWGGCGGGLVENSHRWMVWLVGWMDRLMDGIPSVAPTHPLTHLCDVEGAGLVEAGADVAAHVLHE